MFSPRHSATHKMTKFPLKTGEVEVLTFENVQSPTIWICGYVQFLSVIKNDCFNFFKVHFQTQVQTIQRAVYSCTLIITLGCSLPRWLLLWQILLMSQTSLVNIFFYTSFCNQSFFEFLSLLLTSSLLHFHYMFVRLVSQIQSTIK